MDKVDKVDRVALLSWSGGGRREVRSLCPAREKGEEVVIPTNTTHGAKCDACYGKSSSKMVKQRERQLATITLTLQKMVEDKQANLAIARASSVN